MNFSAGTRMNIPDGTFNDINSMRNLNQNTSRLRNNHAGRDQNIYHFQVQARVVEVHLPSPQQMPRQTPLPGIYSANNLTPTPKTSSQISAYQGPEGVSIVDAPICLIRRIVELLIKATDKPKDLTLELQALYDSLVLIRTVIQENEDSLLGLKCLLNLITPEVNQCHTLLQELFNVVHGTWGLDSRIGVVWLSVWQNRWDGNELIVLRRYGVQSAQ